MTVFLPNAFLIIENCRRLRDCSRNCLTLGLKTCVVVTGDQRSYFSRRVPLPLFCSSCARSALRHGSSVLEVCERVVALKHFLRVIMHVDLVGLARPWLVVILGCRQTTHRPIAWANDFIEVETVESLFWLDHFAR